MRTSIVRACSAACLVSAFAASGCSTDGLSFRQDDRVDIIEPKQNADVPVPLEVRWAAEDVDGTFALFLDRAPMRPGQDLMSLVHDNDSCHRVQNCADTEWLSDHNIFITDGTSMQIDTVTDTRARYDRRESHQVTIVLLDADGRRDGEVAWTQEFSIDRSTPDVG